MRIMYDAIPEEDREEEEQQALQSRVGAWRPVVLSLLLFSAAFVGSAITSRRTASPGKAAPLHFRGHDRAALLVHHPRARASSAAGSSSTGLSGGQQQQQQQPVEDTCVSQSSLSWTVSDCDCDTSQVVLAGERERTRRRRTGHHP